MLFFQKAINIETGNKGKTDPGGMLIEILKMSYDKGRSSRNERDPKWEMEYV